MNEHFDPIELTEKALKYGVHVRSLRKRLRGESVRGFAGARCDRAIAELRRERPSAQASITPP